MDMPRVFLDTADVEHIRDAVSTGLIDGVATNPEKMAQARRSYRDVIEEVREFFDGPIAVQAVGGTREELCAAARELDEIDGMLSVKIPAHKEGLAAVKALVPEGICTNATLIFNPMQGLLAALAGSPYISPFIGRAKMAGHDGIETIRTIRRMMDAFELTGTNVVAASVKDVDQVIQAILAGAHSVAVPFHVFNAMCEHAQTSAGAEAFAELFEKVPNS